MRFDNKKKYVIFSEVIYEIRVIFMTQRTKFNTPSTGKSKIEGYDFGKYPKHKFKSWSNLLTKYPVFPVSCGYDEWCKECYRERTFSDTFAIEYVQKGTFIIQQNNIIKRVAPGEIFLVHLDSDSSMRSETEFATKRVIIMEGPLLRQIIENLKLDKVSIVAASDAQNFIHYFDELDELVKKISDENRLKASCLCYSFLLELAKMAKENQHPAELQKALEYIHNHIDCRLTLENIAQNAHTSISTLHRQFRQCLNTSPVNYLIDCKLERAKLLLSNHFYSVKEIAELLSYSSPQFFAREFKKKYGISPKAFKMQLSSKVE